MHVYVRAVEPVKCGTVILLQQIDMSADSARQCEQSEAVAAGLHSWPLPHAVTMQSTVSLATILHKSTSITYARSNYYVPG